MSKHKHYMPVSHLEAGCDPKTPLGQTPYVWRLSKDGEHQSSEWKRILEMAEKVQAAFENATPEKRKQMTTALSTPLADKSKSMSIDDVRELVDHPIQSLLSANVTGIAPWLFKMPFLILETTDSTGFITSDNPCVWFDPALYQKESPFGAGGLISPTLEITLPLSPNQRISFGNSS